MMMNKAYPCLRCFKHFSKPFLWLLTICRYDYNLNFYNNALNIGTSCCLHHLPHSYSCFYKLSIQLYNLHFYFVVMILEGKPGIIVTSSVLTHVLGSLTLSSCGRILGGILWAISLKDKSTLVFSAFIHFLTHRKRTIKFFRFYF